MHLLLLAVTGFAVAWLSGDSRASRWTRAACLTWLLMELILDGWAAIDPDTLPEASAPMASLALDGWGVSPDFGVPVPSGEQTVVAFAGDSFTRGFGVSADQAFPALVAERLTKTTGRPVIGLNHGVVGAGYREIAAVVGGHSQLVGADAVVWTVVLNDLGGTEGIAFDLINRSPPSSPSAVWNQVQRIRDRRTTQRRTVAAYRTALDPATNPEAWAGFEAELALQVERAEARDARLVLVVFPLLWKLSDYPFAEEHARIVALGQRVGAETLDLAPVFAAERPSSLWVSRRDLHPNTRAHALAAEAIAGALAKGSLQSERPDCAGLRWMAGRPTPASLEAYCRHPNLPDAALDFAEEAVGQGLGLDTAMPWTLRAVARSGEEERVAVEARARALLAEGSPVFR